MKEEKIWAVKDGYLVHRDGSIYKLNWRNTGKMRKVSQSKTSHGYLCFNCNGETVRAHRFIASCFIPNPQNLPYINHKDENPLNNNVENLEWCDQKYNVNYGTAIQRMSESKKGQVAWNKGRTGVYSEETLKKFQASSKSKKVLQYTLSGEFVKEWTSTMEIQRVLGFAHQNISACCRGECKSAYKHIWRYKDSLLS